MAEELTVSSTITPHHAPDTRIPRLGFGIYLSPPEVCLASCTTALGAGYRHIDGAQCYGNETEMGHAVKQAGMPRSELFLTTKVLSAAGSVQKTYEKCLESILKIAGDGPNSYLDLLLIHTPSGGPAAVQEMWQALERLNEEGRVKCIGVSNFGIGNIEAMKSYAKIWPPRVLQIELHPWCQQRQIVAYCAEQKIALEAYCSLVRNQKAHNETLNHIADSHKTTSGRVLIRYALQKGWISLAKSDTPSRIRDNLDVFRIKLSTDDMRQLDDLDQGADGAVCYAVTN